MSNFKIIAIFSILIHMSGSNIFSAEQNLLAHWSFDSDTGKEFRDITGNGYDVSCSGLSTSDGVKGKALDCQGNKYELTVANSSKDFNVSTYSIETWFYLAIDPPTINEMAKIFDYSLIESGIRNGFGVHIGSNGYIIFGMSNSTGSNWMVASSDKPVKSKTWYHLVCTYDSAYMKIYLNGVQSAKVAYKGGYPVPKADARIACQTRTDSLVYYRFTGKLDEMKFYNYALSEDTILNHYNEIFPTPSLISVSPDPTYVQKPQLTWHSIKSIDTYRLQIASNKLFSSPIVSIPTSDTFYTPTVNLPYGSIYWRVCNDKDTSHWSNISTFTILDSIVPLIIPYSPDPTRNRKPVLFWHKVAKASSYNIQINNSSTFSSPIISDAISDTSYSPTVNLPAGKIYWKVKSNLGSTYSPIDSFTILNDSIPYLISMNPDTQSNAKPLFKWFIASGATSYKIQIDTIGSFSNPYISVPVSDTMYTPSVNLPNGKIFWRVSASTNSDRYSTVDTFTIFKVGTIFLLNSGDQTGLDNLWIKDQNGHISIKFHNAKESSVSFRILSLKGSTVAQLNMGNISEGTHLIQWDKKDSRGRAIPKGSYLITGKLNGRILSQKITIK
jgi:hypothetical protein